jgi:hypothetical protein
MSNASERSSPTWSPVAPARFAAMSRDTVPGGCAAVLKSDAGRHEKAVTPGAGAGRRRHHGLVFIVDGWSRDAETDGMVRVRG